jgi:hypothetical protein
MAVIQPTLVRVRGENYDGWQVTWPAMNAVTPDSAAPVGDTIGEQAATALPASGGGGQLAGFSDRSFAITGVFTGTVNIQGSNDGGVTWFTLPQAYQPIATLATITTTGILAVNAPAIWIRPSIPSAGTGTVTVTAFFRETTPLR